MVDHSNDHGNSVHFIRYSYVIEYVQYMHMCVCALHVANTTASPKLGQYQYTHTGATASNSQNWDIGRDWCNWWVPRPISECFLLPTLSIIIVSFSHVPRAPIHIMQKLAGRLKLFPLVTSFAANDYLNYCFALTLLLHQWKTIKRLWSIRIPVPSHLICGYMSSLWAPAHVCHVTSVLHETHLSPDNAKYFRPCQTSMYYIESLMFDQSKFVTAFNKHEHTIMFYIHISSAM